MQKKLNDSQTSEVIELYTPHPAQAKIVNSRRPNKIIRCGRQFGKTLMALNEIVIQAIYKPGNYWIVYPSYRQAKMVAWKKLLQIVDKIPQLVVKRQHVDLEIDLSNGSIISLKGSDNEDSLRGPSLNGVIMDEYAFIKPQVYQKIIEPMLSATHGFTWIISTPLGFNHFYDMWNKVNANKWNKFHFTSYDNPFIDKRFLDDKKESLDPDVFEQEYMASFKRLSGLVYKNFDAETHIIPPINDVNPEWSVYMAIDFGQTNPTAVLWIAVKPTGEMVVIDEVYQAGMTISETADRIKAREKNYHISGRTADSAAAQQIKDLEGYGLFLKGISKRQGEGGENYRVAKIKKLSERLAIRKDTGKPNLYVCSNCENLLFEFQNYRYREQDGERNKSETPLKLNDHALDALGDFIYDYDVPVLTRKPRRRILIGGDPITGYGARRI
ncbi:MAG: Terminase-like family protein [Firmicutes bacterium ADurb.Bin419]|nr:MAG: Terminase-like family protein [Firmicutes bacterium ADurb.Bin419]